MKALALALLALTLSGLSPLAAQEDEDAPLAEQVGLTPEEQAQLRCSANFGLVSAMQEAGNEDALQYPPLKERTREFFVQVMASLMDAHDLSREDVTQLLNEEIGAIMAEPDQLDRTMPACLAMLDASGL